MMGSRLPVMILAPGLLIGGGILRISGLVMLIRPAKVKLTYKDLACLERKWPMHLKEMVRKTGKP